MAYLTPSMKHNIALGSAVVTGLILLMGQIPVLGWSTNYQIGGLITLGQLLGIVNLFIAYLLWKKELR